MNFDEWREQARALLAIGQPPEAVDLSGQDLLPFPPVAGVPTTAKVPREFLALAKKVGCFRDPQCWNLLYRVLWRLTHGEVHLLEDHADGDMRQVRLMEKAISRDLHKMRAFVRFRQIPGPAYVAWHKPEHLIVETNAPFFVRRFGAMQWAILTPDTCAYWDTAELRFGPGLTRDDAPPEDQLESLWLTYYSSIFNPARINLKAMTNEMAVRHWETLPESKLINELLRNAQARVESMILKQPSSAKPFVPEGAELPQLASAVQSCQGCELYLHATQAVFGEGVPTAKIVFVGEQPGDQEDLSGKPFVGPAGKVLNRALEEAGIDRETVYVTNAVKHFRFEERGKRRIHKKPSGGQISACRPWLEAELSRIRPETIVCLGASAAQSLVGRDVKIGAERGKVFESQWAARLIVTVHPSALLRLPDPSMFEEEFARFVEDLKRV